MYVIYWHYLEVNTLYECLYNVLLDNTYLALMEMPYERYTYFRFANITKSIGVRMIHFLILCSSLLVISSVDRANTY